MYPVILTTHRLAGAFALAAALSSAVAAQPVGDPTWFALTPGAAPGMQAEVMMVQNSSAHDTVFDLRIHGFWMQPTDAPDGTTYQRIRVPGLSHFGKVGAPDLPVFRAPLALTTTATDAYPQAFDFMQEFAFNGVDVYPFPQEGSDEEIDPSEDPGPGDPDGYDDIFVKDAGIYAMQAPWPELMDGGEAPVHTSMAVIPTCDIQCHPVSWNPDTKQLKVAALSRWHWTHPGSITAAVAVTSDKLHLVEQTFLNYSVVNTDLIELHPVYHSRYLIVTPATYENTLYDFRFHKKWLGYEMTIETTAMGDGWWDVRQMIGEWYDQGDPSMDHYCLLIGDVGEMPSGTFGATQYLTDDYYGSPWDLDQDEEVYVGRLSIDNASDLDRQLRKIIDYEANPVIDGDYDRALLIAHKQGAPGKYEAAHEDVRTAGYGVPPTFQTSYGSAGFSNGFCQIYIAQGTGVVAYRGHGSTNAFTGWNNQEESFHKNQVIELSPHGVLPVVWAITCTNANLNGGDSIAEVWMEVDGRGAVASYGATRTTGTTANHELDRRLFQGLYDFGLTTHGHLIAFAETLMFANYPTTENHWRYLLLGDPSMKVRRTKPAGFVINGTTLLSMCVGCEGSVDFNILTQSAGDGGGQEGTLVTFYKPSMIPGQPDEVFHSGYTNQNGDISLTVMPTTPGDLYFAVRDAEGNVHKDTIPVTFDGIGSWADLGNALAGTLGNPQLEGFGTIIGGTPVAIVLSNALPNSVAALCLGWSELNAPFKGGVFVPFPNLIVSGIPTGLLGEINIPDEWPGGIPSGFSFYAQYWITDPAGPLGFSASNAISGTTP